MNIRIDAGVAKPLLLRGRGTEGMEVVGDLDLSGSPLLERLPDGLSVRGSLDLSECGRLASLPKGLDVSGCLDVRGCLSLSELPPGLRVGGALLILGRVPLRAFPADVKVGGMLDLSWNRTLGRLPEGLAVGDMLFLTDCVSLKELPEGLRLGGDLNLAGAGLRSLAERLSTGERPPWQPEAGKVARMNAFNSLVAEMSAAARAGRSRSSGRTSSWGDSAPSRGCRAAWPWTGPSGPPLAGLCASCPMP